jgi:hypothetical protein
MMPALTVLAAFLLSISVLPRSGRAVSYDTLALGRVGSFTLIVEAIDVNSNACGIRKSDIFNAIEYPLVGTGLQVVPSGDVILGVSIVSIIIYTWTCVTTYILSMIAHVPVDFRGQSSLEDVLLWSSTGIISSDVSNHASRFAETLRQQARELVVSWSGARQGRTIFNRR